MPHQGSWVTGRHPVSEDLVQNYSYDHPLGRWSVCEIGDQTIAHTCAALMLIHHTLAHKELPKIEEQELSKGGKYAGCSTSTNSHKYDHVDMKPNSDANPVNANPNQRVKDSLTHCATAPATSGTRRDTFRKYISM